ncbi:MAG: isoprenylcysteine carboxylmethyltransferase family protein [Deltaproteobacteria bacterium]|nr:isoprenylcysteine carboxylmethyltransferase family protein [Deltaproteobacteria bacterium]
MCATHLHYTLWSLWLIYWLWRSWGNKKFARHETLIVKTTYLAPLIAGVCLLLPFPAFPAIFTIRFYETPVFLVWAGVLMTVVGLLLSVWARHCLAGNWSAFVSIKEAHVLVRTGPYALVRHPIYSGIFLALVGGVITSGEIKGVVALVLIFFSFVYKINREEEFMRSRFADQYAAYQQTTKKLIPFM